MTTVERITGLSDRVKAEAATVHLGRMFLVALAALFFTVGWVAGKASLGVRLLVGGIKVGWADARKVRDGAA